MGYQRSTTLIWVIIFGPLIMAYSRSSIATAFTSDLNHFGSWMKIRLGITLHRYEHKYMMIYTSDHGFTRSPDDTSSHPGTGVLLILSSSAVSLSHCAPPRRVVAAASADA